MSMKMMKSHPLMKIMTNSIVDLPSPSNINTLWNMGSILGLCLTTQITTGIFLAMHYKSDHSIAFSSVIHICYDVNYGWLMRTIHANGASLFFVAMYLHTGRGLYFGSYRFMETWNIGVIIMLTTMATAFLGYVLPWGQMSFWGATVITNLLSAIPYIGTSIVQWLWGGFAVADATLSRFFSLHFLMPFMIAGMSAIHLLFLHETGSNNPLGINSNFDKIPFHPYFSVKDTVGFIMAMTALISLSLMSPYELGDPENFLPANPLSTPVHIKPEWYFLFAYAILRSIPNKIGGVIALVMSILILMSMPMTHMMKLRSTSMYPLNKCMFWTLITSTVLLTWIGARPVEAPFITIGQILTTMYFLYFILNPLMHQMWDTMNKK